MVKKTLVIILCLMHMGSTSSFAESALLDYGSPREERDGLTPVQVSEAYLKMKAERLLFLREMDANKDGVVDSADIDYGEDGNIEKVVYDDGLEVEFSYKYDERGDISSIGVSDDKGVFLEVYALDRDGDSEKGMEKLDLHEEKSRETLNCWGATHDNEKAIRDAIKRGGRPIIVIIIEGGNSSGSKGPPEDSNTPPTLEDIAKEPIDPDVLRHIRDTLQGMSEGGLGAHQECQDKINKNLNKYYVELKNAFAEMRDSLMSENPELGLDSYLESLDGSDGKGIEVLTEEERVLIDEAVEKIHEIYTEAQSRDDDYPTAAEFVRAVKEFREEFEDENRRIYGDRAIKVKKVYNRGIEELKYSEPLLFFMRNKYRIEFTLKLPQDAEQDLDVAQTE